MNEQVYQKGFNRYMVECEFNKAYNKTSSVPVLIDTWWNVNLYPSSGSLLPELVLIDTWWNVNLMKLAVIMLYHVF